MDDRKTAVTAATDAVDPGKGLPRDTIIAGKYQVESTLGFGGMGVVLAARHLQLDERVAIKILRDDVQREPEHVERFMREAQAAVRLKSEHVARIDDVAMLPDGKPYMVMELLEGVDLGRLLHDSGHLAPALAADLVLQVCDALAEAHANGIVHRDIKPTNLFVTSRRDGTPLVKVLDFGISKAASSDLSLTQTSSMLGTPAYMSPEQMRSARLADARSDIWSLGTVLYELLEGRTPFEASSFAELCVAVATENPRDMINAPALQPVLARALAKSPDERYPSIAELAEDLAPHTSDPHQADRQVRRIFRLLGKTPPLGGRDSTPAVVRVRESASNLRHHTFAGEEASTIANAAPTFHATPRRRPLWLAAAGLALLALGAAITVLVLTGSSRDRPATGSAAASDVASGAAASAPPDAATVAHAGTAADSQGSAAGAAPAGSSDAPGAGANAVAHAGSGADAGAGSSAEVHVGSNADVHVGSSTDATTHRPPPHRQPPRPAIHRAPPHRPPPAQANVSTPMAGSAAPPRPKCDPFANPKGCPAT